MPTEPEYAAPNRLDPNDPADPNDRLRDAVDAATADAEPQEHDPQPPDRQHRDEPQQRERVPRPVVITPVEDPEAAISHRLAAKITAGAHIVATTTAEWIRLIAEFDERDGASFYWGLNSTAHFLSVYCSTGTSTAREHVRVARSLVRMPLIAAAFDAGRLSYSKVRECARIAGQVDEDLLLKYAESLSAAQLEASIRTFRRTRKDRLEAEQLRRASWSTSHDGTVTLRAVLPAEEGARVIAALEKARDYLNSPSHASGTAASAGTAAGAAAGQGAPAGAPGGPDTTPDSAATEPLAFTRADALLEVAASYLAHAPRDHSGADRDLVVVHVGVSVLATPLPTTPDTGVSAPAAARPDSGAPAGAQRGTDVPARARHDSGPPAGASSQQDTQPGSTPQAMDPQACAIARDRGDQPRHRATPRLRRDDPDHHLPRRRARTESGPRETVRHQSPTPRPDRARQLLPVPRCGRTRNLDAHHIVHWAFGGPSDLDNYVLLCAHHHTLVHEGSLTITKTPLRDLGPASWAAGDRWTFTRIGGQKITAEQTTRTIAYDVENETRHGERALLADLIADVTDLDHPYADAIRPTWGGEAGGGRTATDDLLANAEQLDAERLHATHAEAVA